MYRWFLVALFLFSACDALDKAEVYDPAGSILVKWKIAGNTCDMAGIEFVRVELAQDGEVAKGFGLSAACTEGENGVTLNDVPVGLWDVQISATNTLDQQMYVGEAAGIVVEKGVESTLDEPISLMAKDGSILVRWSFPLDAATCGFSMIDKVEISALETDTGIARFNKTLDCDPDSTDLVDGWVEVDSLPTGVQVEIVLFGLNELGNRTHFGSASMEVPGTGTVTVVIPLEPCEESCI